MRTQAEIEAGLQQVIAFGAKHPAGGQITTIAQTALEWALGGQAGILESWLRPKTHIKTAFIRPSIPTRVFDWVAWVDGQDGPHGNGESEAQATLDLLDRLPCDKCDGLGVVKGRLFEGSCSQCNGSGKGRRLT